MQRRSVLRGLIVAIPAAAGIAAAAASKSRTYLADASEVTLETIKAEIDEIKARFEATDAKNRKLIRAAVLLGALSLGVDLSTLL